MHTMLATILTPIDVAIVLLFSLILVAPFFWRLRLHSVNRTLDEYYLANRKLPVFYVAASLAGSWVWAPALFVCSQMAFEKGLAGAFWFIVPNVACFYVLIPIARRAKRNYSGCTLAGYFYQKTGNSRSVLIVFTVITLAFQMCAIIENNIALSQMLSVVTDLSATASVISLLVITLVAVLLIILHGFRGSVVTDMVQMIVMIALCIGVAMTVTAFASQESNPLNGLGGRTGEFLNPLTLSVVVSPGIAFLLGLTGGPMADMMFFQRVMALQTEKEVTQALSLAGLLFAIVPVTLSLPGFVAAAAPGAFVNANPETIGLTVTAAIAPKVTVIMFCIIVVSGLMTTVFSAYSAITAIVGSDITILLNRPFNNASARTIRFSWVVMTVLALIGFLVAISGVSLLPVFLTDTGIASSMIVPVLYLTFSRTPTPREVIVPAILSFTFAVVFGAAGAILDSALLASIAAPGAFLLGLISLVLVRYIWRRRNGE